MLIDPSGSKIEQTVGPSLPSSYNDRFPGIPVDREGGPCTEAARRKTQVIVSDVASDTRWDTYGWRSAALTHRLKACWSTTILASTGLVLGTFAIYWREPRTPTEQDQKIIEQITHLAAVAIERKRNEAALTKALDEITKSEAELRTIIDAIPQLIIAIGADGNFLHANQAVLEYTGLTKEEVRSEKFLDVFHPEDSQRLRHDRASALLRRTPFEYERRVRHRDGQFRWLLVQYNPLLDERGEVIRWYATGTDIDDRKQAEERTRQENFALREQIDQVFMFEEIVGSSSALKTVLSSILRFTNFRTSNGPDVHVYLVAADDARDNASVLRAGFIDLGSIKGNIGDQNYALGADVDLAKYRTVSVWCKRFSINFGVAPLRTDHMMSQK
jgi:PAS domain S-box-containing protein